MARTKRRIPHWIPRKNRTTGELLEDFIKGYDSINRRLDNTGRDRGILVEQLAKATNRVEAEELSEELE